MGAERSKTTMTSEQNNFAMRGTLEGHCNWVTAIATTNENPDMILSASRDKTVMVWQLTREDGSYGYPKKALRGHGHFVEDVVISSDGQFALSGSWDGTLRLWDLNTGLTTRRFVGHEKDVLSVAFSADNRQIVSGSRDKTIKLWNTLGECKYTIVSDGEGHGEWVSCVSLWLPVCLRWQGRCCHALGPQRGQAPLLSPLRAGRHHPCSLLLPQPLLALRRHGPGHPHLGPRG